MYLIALTGGIASGKSVIAARLEHLGAILIDADKLARDVVKPGEPAFQRIIDEFGQSVVAADGALDRSALGSIIFSDPVKRALLNAITHPAVRALAKQRMRDAAIADPMAVIVYDIPLLIETGSAERYDLIVVASASEAVRVNRLTELRGMSEEEARGRMAAQATDAQRLAVADVVIDTDGSMADTLRQVDALWHRSAAAAEAAESHASDGSHASDSAGGKQRQ